MRENGKNSTRHIRMVFSILVLVFVLATGTPIPNLNGVVAYAKTKKENPKISKKRKNLKRKKSFTIKVSGTKKKVKWSVSDKSLVKIKKKGKNKAKITAKKKDGACVVKAVVGGKSLYCLVSVNGSTKMSEKTRKWAVAGGFVKNKSDKTDSSKNSGSEEEKQDSTDGNKDKKPSGGSGTGDDSPKQETEGTKTKPQERTSPKYSYTARVVNINEIYTRGEGDFNARGVLIKVTTNNPDWDDVAFKVDGTLTPAGFVRFDDVSGNGYRIARVPFQQAGTHTVKIVEGYWADEAQGDYRTVDTNVTVTFTVKDFETERTAWIDSLIANHRRATDKETLQAISDWLVANLHYIAYIVDANGNLVRRASLMKQYGSMTHGWTCWDTTALMIDVAKRLNPSLTGYAGTMAGNDPEVDWHRFAVIVFPDGTDEAYDACPSPNEFYQIGSIEMVM